MKKTKHKLPRLVQKHIPIDPDATRCMRCGREEDVVSVFVRVAGKATLFHGIPEDWCVHCRRAKNGTYRKVQR